MKKARVIKSWSKRNLPMDLWPEILSRLPVKSLLRFRCVSKLWQSLIDDPDFCRLHLNRFKRNCQHTHLCVLQEDDKGQHCVVRRSNTFKTTARLASLGGCRGYDNNLNFPTLGYPGGWDVVCSIDGLVMLTEFRSSKLLLWNPSIKKFRSLPPVPNISNAMTCTDLGLGFDPLIMDYKHVRFVHQGHESLHFIAVFTVGIGSWKTIQFQGKGCSSWRWPLGYGFGVRTICCRGCLYFIAKNLDSGTKELVTFDLSNEMFASTCLPLDEVAPHNLDEELLKVDGGCSLMTFCYYSNNGSVWMLESSRTDSESMYWTKRYSFTMGTGLFEFLYLSKNGNLLLYDGRKVTSFNLETNEETRLVKIPRSLVILVVFDYIESLVLLK